MVTDFAPMEAQVFTNIGRSTACPDDQEALVGIDCTAMVVGRVEGRSSENDERLEERDLRLT